MALKILIVDDRSENIFALMEILRESDVEIESAQSGFEALKILSQPNNVGLALIDIQMPEMNGFELAMLMRGVERIRHIPIIFVTADVPTGDFEFRGYESGAVDILYKPINPQILKSKIEVFKRLQFKARMLGEKIQELESANLSADLARQKAEEADRTKSSFLARMSHEIRTPLTALIGFAELLKLEGVSKNLRDEYVGIILRNSHSLLELINDILDLSKVEADQLTTENVVFDIKQCMSDVIELIGHVAAKNNVDLRLKIADEVPGIIFSDPLRFRQIVLNMVGNAIKFSRNGRVEIRVETCEEASKICIFVDDTGIGISSDQQELLFKPFNQLSSDKYRIFGGTGLGLALSKKLAHLLGGDIWLVKSEAGVGSSFCFKLDSNSEHAKKVGVISAVKEKSIYTSAPLQKILKNLNVLMVDDSQDNQMLVQVVLSRYGARIHLADNGHCAIDLVAKMDIDIILMDYQMPGCDGLEATKILRDQGFTKPIVLLTANAMKGERERAIEHGASGYITKPINWDVLITTISKLCHR